MYYGCLAGFFALFLNVFFVTMDETVPSQTDMNSLIKGNPGNSVKLNLKTVLTKDAGSSVEPTGQINVSISLVRMSDNRNVKKNQSLIHSKRKLIDFFAFLCEIVRPPIFNSRVEQVMFVTTAR